MNKLKEFIVEYSKPGMKTIKATTAEVALNLFFQSTKIKPCSAVQNHPRAVPVDVVGVCINCSKLITKYSDLVTDWSDTTYCKACFKELKGNPAASKGQHK
ncbi:MAG: hypothetical protein WC907_06145 [Acholeplasmataceae bacterium]|jgi:hypothetical protein